jgi:hypothetical protein
MGPLAIVSRGTGAKKLYSTSFPAGKGAKLLRRTFFPAGTVRKNRKMCFSPRERMAKRPLQELFIGKKCFSTHFVSRPAGTGAQKIILVVVPAGMDGKWIILPSAPRERMVNEPIRLLSRGKKGFKNRFANFPAGNDGKKASLTGSSLF